MMIRANSSDVTLLKSWIGFSKELTYSLHADADRSSAPKTIRTVSPSSCRDSVALETSEPI